MFEQVGVTAQVLGDFLAPDGFPFNDHAGEDQEKDQRRAAQPQHPALAGGFDLGLGRAFHQQTALLAHDGIQRGTQLIHDLYTLAGANGGNSRVDSRSPAQLNATLEYRQPLVSKPIDLNPTRLLMGVVGGQILQLFQAVRKGSNRRVVGRQDSVHHRSA